MPTSSRAALIDAYLASLPQLRRAVADLSPEQLKARPVPGKWSTLEVVCHLVDSEQAWCHRMKRVIAEDRPLLIGYDETRFTAALPYHENDLEEELALLEGMRHQMARTLRSPARFGLVAHRRAQRARPDDARGDAPRRGRARPPSPGAHPREAEGPGTARRGLSQHPRRGLVRLYPVPSSHRLGRHHAPDDQPPAVLLLQDDHVAAGLPAGFPLDRVLDVVAVVHDDRRSRRRRSCPSDSR